MTRVRSSTTKVYCCGDFLCAVSDDELTISDGQDALVVSSLISKGNAVFNVDVLKLTCGRTQVSLSILNRNNVLSNLDVIYTTGDGKVLNVKFTTQLRCGVFNDCTNLGSNVTCVGTNSCCQGIQVCLCCLGVNLGIQSCNVCVICLVIQSSLCCCRDRLSCVRGVIYFSQTKVCFNKDDITSLGVNTGNSTTSTTTTGTGDVLKFIPGRCAITGFHLVSICLETQFTLSQDRVSGKPIS